MSRTELRNYTRWRTDPRDPDGQLVADLLGTDAGIVADPQRGLVSADITGRLTPDEARLIGVRLIEAAALADSNRAIRGTPEAVQA